MRRPISPLTASASWWRGAEVRRGPIPSGPGRLTEEKRHVGRVNDKTPRVRPQSPRHGTAGIAPAASRRRGRRRAAREDLEEAAARGRAVGGRRRRRPGRVRQRRQRCRRPPRRAAGRGEPVGHPRRRLAPGPRQSSRRVHRHGLSPRDLGSARQPDQTGHPGGRHRHGRVHAQPGGVVRALAPRHRRGRFGGLALGLAAQQRVRGPLPAPGRVPRGPHHRGRHRGALARHRRRAAGVASARPRFGPVRGVVPEGVVRLRPAPLAGGAQAADPVRGP